MLAAAWKGGERQMELNDSQWRAADSIARELVRRDCDPNEVQKAFVYLRTHKDPERLFRFLSVLVQRGQLLVRSGRTLGYYGVVQEVAQRHLAAYRADATTMMQILGWAVRLMRYYKARTPSQPQSMPPGRRAPSRWRRR